MYPDRTLECIFNDLYFYVLINFKVAKPDFSLFGDIRVERLLKIKQSNFIANSKSNS